MPDVFARNVVRAVVNESRKQRGLGPLLEDVRFDHLADDLEPVPVADSREWLDEYDPNAGSETQKDWHPEDLR